MGKGDNLGEFEQLVMLAILRSDGEAYGMQVLEEIQRTTGRSVTIGAVYGTLERLEEKRFISSAHSKAGSGRSGRARRWFRLEPSGVEALTRAREMLASMWSGVELPAGKLIR